MKRETRHLIADAKPPEWAAEEVIQIEHELDQLHPPWRRRVTGKGGKVGIIGSRGIEDMGKKARVKWLLQRRKYLYAGKDWQVKVLSFQGRGGQQKLIAAPKGRRRRRLTPAQIQAAAERRTTAADVGKRLGTDPRRVERLTIKPN